MDECIQEGTHRITYAFQVHICRTSKSCQHAQLVDFFITLLRKEDVIALIQSLSKKILLYQFVCCPLMCSDSLNSFITSTAPIFPAICFLVHRMLALNSHVVQILQYFKRHLIITANLFVWCTELQQFCQQLFI